MVGHGPHQGAQTSTRTGMVLRAIWRSNISAATSSGCPAKTSALHFPYVERPALGKEFLRRLIPRDGAVICPAFERGLDRWPR